MRRFIRQLLLFLPFCAAAYLVLLVVWGEASPRCLQRNLNYRRGTGHLLTRLREARETGPVDVLVLGSSHAYRGFDPRIFADRGLRMFNLGSRAQTPLHTRILLDRYLDGLRPQMVIWEVFPLTFTIDGVEATLDLLANDVHDRHVRELVGRHRHLAVFHNYLFMLYRRATGLDRLTREHRVAGPDTYVAGGFVEHTGEAGERRLAPGGGPADWKLRDDQLEAFRQALDLLRERGIPVVLVQAPIPSALRGAYRNNDEFDKWMSELGRYWNFNHLVDLDDDLHFFDDHHLNQDGVRAFNEALLDRFQAEGLLPEGNHP